MHDVRQRKEQLLRQYFPALIEGADDALVEQSRCMRFPGGLRLSQPGDVCKDYLLVTEGGLRVQVMTETGRDVMLYEVLPGEGCVLTTSCLLGHGRFPAEAVTLADTDILALPAASFHQAIVASPQFRVFVFENFGQRLAGVIGRIEQLCAPCIDRTLAEALLRHCDGRNGALRITHQQLALELGTAREVVSRHLKHFESQGGLRLGRGTIDIQKPEFLDALARKRKP